MAKQTGTIGVLSVGAGDFKLSFDPSNPVERERAKRIVTDMLLKGYAILIQVGEQDGEPIYRRAKAFDPNTCEYIIDGVPDVEKQPTEAKAEAEQARQKKVRIKKPKTRFDAERTNAVAVGRTSGG